MAVQAPQIRPLGPRLLEAVRENWPGVPRDRYLVFAAIAIVGAGIDLWTKAWIFGVQGLPDRGPRNVWWIVGEFFGFETNLNPGALFGMKLGMESSAVFFFAGISVVAAVAIVVWLFAFGAAWDRWVNVALACITAGILGNLYDRLGFWAPDDYPMRHAVRDWILFEYKGNQWPNFNIADSFLVCGAAMLAWHALVRVNPKFAAKVP